MAEREIRVMRIINRFNLGGPTYNVAYLSRYLDAPFKTRLIGGMKDEHEASSEFILGSLGLEGEVIPEMRRSINPFQDVLAYRSLRKAIRETKPHIVHTHAAKAGTLGRLAALHEGVPVVLHTFHGHVFHSYFGKLKTGVFKAIERYLASRSSGIVCISEEQKHEIGTEHAICDPAKIRVIPLGFDLDRFNIDMDQKRKAFRERYELAEEDVAIGIVGRLVPVKNHAMFLRAIQSLLQKEEHKNCRFFIIGDGESKQDLLNWCETNALPYRWMEAPDADAPLCFTSWIREVDEVYAGLDLVTLTSLNEGTPVSLIEAQSAALPVISTEVGGVASIVADGESGFLCAVNDDATFQQKLSELALSKAQRQRFGSFGREAVRVQYHYRRLVSDMRTYYNDLLDNIE